MTDTPASTPAETPPVDRRPRPQFGELAPEGWVWEPPVTDAVPADTPAEPVTSAAEASSTGASAAPPPAHSVPGWDRGLTLSLLIFGLLAALTTIAMFTGLTTTMQTVYTQQDLGTYTPAASLPALVVLGSTLAGLVWALTATAAIRLLVRARRAFYIPLIGGVLSTVVTIVVMMVILGTDPTLVNSVG